MAKDSKPPKPADPCANGCAYQWDAHMQTWVLRANTDCPDFLEHLQ